MFGFLRQLISVCRRISPSTHLRCLSVLGAAVLLCVSFFVEPSDRRFIADDDESLRAQIIIEYSSVLGSLSGLDGLEHKVVEEIVDAIPSDIDEVEAGNDGDAADNTDRSNNDMIADILAAEDIIYEPEDEFTVDLTKVYSPEAVDALERLVQCEAATEDYKGRVLVADVVLNRVDTGIWGDDILSVIESPGQFDPVSNGAYKNTEVDPVTKEAVLSALTSTEGSEGAIYFQKSRATSWGGKKFLFRHGSHSFYK